MEKNLPLVTISIPTFNSEKFIGLCLEAIKKQTYQNIEVNIIDGNSKDRTIDIVKKYDFNVSICKKALLGARDEGVKIANGEFILLLDSDQILEETAIERAVNKVNEGFDMLVLKEDVYRNKNFIEHLFQADRDLVHAVKDFNPMTSVMLPRFYRTDLLKKVFQGIPVDVKNEVGGQDHAIIYFEAYRLSKKVTLLPSAVKHIEPNSLMAIWKKFYRWGYTSVGARKNKYTRLIDKKERFRKGLFGKGLFNKSLMSILLLLLKGVPYKVGYYVRRYSFQKNNRVKNIIPDLVSFDTNLKKIKGFSLSDNFDFYSNITSKNQFHYKIFVVKDIEIPKEYNFRSGYYFKKAGIWYYERKLFCFSFKFKYDAKNKIFSFNKAYSYLPFEIGSIYPVGRHLNDLIGIDLFLNGYDIFKGCAFVYKNITYCFVAPSFNGKTSFLYEAMGMGSKYIAEDMLVVDARRHKVYPTSCFKNNFGRSINNRLLKILKKNIVIKSVNYDRMFLLENSLFDSDKDKKIYNKEVEKNIGDFISLCSLFFLNNNFIRAFIFKESKSDRIKNRLKELETCLNFKYFKINNFNFKKLLTYEK